MSDVEHRLKHNKHLANDKCYIAKQMMIAKRFGLENKRVGHRLHKLNAVTCGNSNCIRYATSAWFLNISQGI